MKVYPFFLYGTARIGQGLNWLIQPITEDYAIAPALNVEMLVDASAHYPYLVHTEYDSTEMTYIWGDLCLLRESETLTEFIAMEQAVGYRLEAVRMDGNIFGVDFALAFIWPHSQHGMTPLGSNSWVDWNAKRSDKSLSLVK